MLRRFTILPLLLFFLAAPGCARKPADHLTVGLDLSYPPFEMTDEQGKPAGVSVDLAHALGEALHKPVVLQNIPFDGLLPSLKTGKIDLIISSMTATPERAESIDFSDPYLTTGLALLVGAKSGIQSVADLNQPGKTVVVKSATTGQLYAAEHLKAPRVLVLDQESTAALEVAQGKADAFIYDQMSTLKHWQQHPETTRALLQPFKTEPWAIGIRKGNDDLRKQVNAFLQDFRARGGFDQLGNRWLKEQKEAFQKLGIPFVF
jgi:polar amino acid transport system substrate-binding protein